MTTVTQDIQPILKKYPNARRDSLITILQEVQDAQGYVSKESVIAIGQYLRLPARCSVSRPSTISFAFTPPVGFTCKCAEALPVT